MRNHWLDQRKQKIQDLYSLQALADGDWTLDMIYPWQFVQNERAESKEAGSRFNRYQLEHTPVLSGTLTGTVYRGVDPIQVFYMSSSGTFFAMTDQNYTDKLKPSDTRVTNGTLNLVTGVLTFEWDKEPGEHHLIVSYEYNLECQRQF